MTSGRATMATHRAGTVKKQDTPIWFNRHSVHYEMTTRITTSCAYNGHQLEIGYATALEDTVDTGKLFRSRSLREFEETLFCHTKSSPISWDTYWDLNDPLRDVDEAAVPVLCICSADDPVCGPPERTLPAELFHSNPYFFLLLSHRGGHCGFLRQEPLPAWSHEVILESFRALTEFFRMEERMKGLSRRRTSFLGGRRRWGALQKREVSPSSSLEEIFSWKRSYTR